VKYFDYQPRCDQRGLRGFGTLTCMLYLCVLRGTPSLMVFPVVCLCVPTRVYTVNRLSENARLRRASLRLSPRRPPASRRRVTILNVCLRCRPLSQLKMRLTTTAAAAVAAASPMYLPIAYGHQSITQRCDPSVCPSICLVPFPLPPGSKTVRF